jgi:hypothetical protein
MMNMNYWEALSQIVRRPDLFAHADSYVAWAARNALRSHLLTSARLGSDIWKLSDLVGVESVVAVIENLSDTEALLVLGAVDESAAQHLGPDRARKRLVAIASRGCGPASTSENPIAAPPPPSRILPAVFRTLRKHKAFDTRRHRVAS